MVQYSFWCQNQYHIIIHKMENGMYTLNTHFLFVVGYTYVSDAYNNI